MLVEGAQGSTGMKCLACWFRKWILAPDCLGLCSDRLGMPATGKERDRRSQGFADPLKTGKSEFESVTF